MSGYRRATAGLVAGALVAVLAACGGDEGEPPPRTDRERDSLIAQSALPHASGVGAALRAQDRAASVNSTLDSIAGTVP